MLSVPLHTVAIVIMLVIGVPLVAMPVAVSVVVLYAVRIYCLYICLLCSVMTCTLCMALSVLGYALTGRFSLCASVALFLSQEWFFCCFSFHSGVGLNTGLGCRVLCLVTPLGLCLPCWVVFLPL